MPTCDEVFQLRCMKARRELTKRVRTHGVGLHAGMCGQRRLGDPKGEVESLGVGGGEAAKERCDDVAVVFV